jgi:hypothetical protein
MIQKRTHQTACGIRFMASLHRRLTFFFLFCTVALVAFERPLLALSVTPTIQQFDLNAGQKKKSVYTITNDDPWDMSIVPESKDWFVLPENKAAAITAKDWLVVKGATITLKPGESREVPFEVHVPKSAIGELVGMVSFRMTGGPDKFVRKVFSVAVYAGIEGTQKPQAKIIAAMVDTSSPTLIGGFFLQNVGNIHLRPTGLVQVFNEKDVNVVNITIQRASPIYPGEKKPYSGEIPNYSLPPGDYSAKISITDSDRGIVIPETVKKFRVLKNRQVEAR